MIDVNEGQIEVDDAPDDDNEQMVEISEEERYLLAKRGLRYDLFHMQEIDEDLAATDEFISECLMSAIAELERLLELRPDDPDLFILGELFEDMVLDYLDDEDIEDDDGYEQVLSTMQDMIEYSPVERVGIEDLGGLPRVQAVVDQLQELDVPIEVVLSGRENAPVLVLCLQIHPNPGLSDEDCEKLGVIDSQAEIERILEAGIAEQVLLEGLEFDDPLRGGHFFGWRHQLSFARVIDSNPELFKTRGYEDRETSFSDSSIPYRTTGVNAFLGSNIAELVHRNPDQVTGAIVGGAHEIQIDGKEVLLEGHFEEGLYHELPLSEVIAYYGVDVVVVDTMSSYIDPQGIREFQAARLGMEVDEMLTLIREKMTEG